MATFPYRWTVATITPLPKAKVVHNLGEHRPVSLTPDLDKLLEGLVACCLMPSDPSWMRGNMVIWWADQLSDIYSGRYIKGFGSTWHHGDFDADRLQEGIWLVDHTVTVTQLYHLGCRPSIMEFVADFLTGHRHRASY